MAEERPKGNPDREGDTDPQNTDVAWLEAADDPWGVGVLMDKVSFVLDHGADVNARDQRGFTSLHRATEMGHVDVVRVLLDRDGHPPTRT